MSIFLFLERKETSAVRMEPCSQAPKNATKQVRYFIQVSDSHLSFKDRHAD